MMSKKHTLDKVKFLIGETILIFVIVVGFLIIYSGGFEEILSVMIGLFATQIITNATLIFKYKREDKSKLSEEDYRYDESYKNKLTFWDKTTELWYAPCVNDVNATYNIKDTDKFTYKLPSLIECNYVSLLGAHSASIIRNETMIRFDDYEYDEEKNEATVYTSRTTFFNDLVTNRVSDYKINDGVSVRNIYESGKFLTPLNESKFSNHIGINAMVFIGDELIFTLRGSTGTISKNMLTSTVAIGVSKDAFVNEYTFEDNIRERIVTSKLGEMLNLETKVVDELLHSGKMKVYCMGFGRHIYMGGKPQFYYAVTIEKGSVVINTEKAELSNVVDFNTCMIPVKRLELAKNNGYILKLTTAEGKTIKREAERSFFVNYWHIVSQPRIHGIPDWFYNCAKGTNEEKTNEMTQ